jgi:hypothetical protein|nr:MAG: hypothetical protein [Cressdnaviricota sp.]
MSEDMCVFCESETEYLFRFEEHNSCCVGCCKIVLGTFYADFLLEKAEKVEKQIDDVENQLEKMDVKNIDSRQWAECCECQKLTKEKRYVYIKDIVLKCYIPFCEDCNNQYK